MGYNEFLEQITRNANNKLENYKELCRVCLKNHSNGVEISENSFSSIERRETIRSNYITITKKYVHTSMDKVSIHETDENQQTFFVLVATIRRRIPEICVSRM